MIVVDVETTGIFPSKHQLVSIGAVEFENPKNQFYGECRLDEGVEVDPRALEINGFKLKDLQSLDKQSLRELIQAFLDWCANFEDKTLAGHNTFFDADFLRTASRQLKKSPSDHVWPFGYRVVDMHSIAYAISLQKMGKVGKNKYGYNQFWSGGVYDFVGLPAEPDPHNALTGAKMEAEALSRLIYGRSLFKEYAHLVIPQHLKPAKA